MVEDSSSGDFQQWKAEIGEIIEKLQQAVAACNWDEVNQLLIFRQQRLEAFFQSPAGQVQTPALVQWAEQIKQLDLAMENQIRQQQAAIKQALNQVGKGRKAVAAYRSL